VINAGFDGALLHSLVIFVAVTVFWARPLLVLYRRAKPGKPSFPKGSQSKPSAAA